MTRVDPATRNVLLVSMASWLLVAVITNMIGNTAPVLFQFLRYFVACSMFGLGLGFFTSDRGGHDGDKSANREWAIWLALICLALFLFACADCPGGLANAVALALLDESRDVFDFSLIKHSTMTDLFAVIFCSALLFATTQLFVSPGRELKKQSQQSEGAPLLWPFALAALIAWSTYSTLSHFGAPPFLILALPCLILLSLCKFDKMPAILSLFAVVSTLCANSAGPPLQKNSSEIQAKVESTCWTNGQRVDAVSLLSGSRKLSEVVYVDRLPFQVLPAPDLNAGETTAIEKYFNLPAFSCDFRQLPYMAMPSMAGKRALIVGAGLGSETQVCLAQGAAHVDAVEPNSWLSTIAGEQQFNPFKNPAVTLFSADPLCFLRQSREKFDLIFYTLQSAGSQGHPFTPLNHSDFLFTAENIAAAFGHLNQGGRLVFATLPANEILRLRLAATLHAVCPKLEASLTTPFANYLIVANNDDPFAAADSTVLALRKKLGGKIVNHEQWLTAGLSGVDLYTNNRPFMIGQAAMMPLSEIFFYIAGMLAMLLSMRRQTPDTMLQNCNRQRCRSLILGAILMVTSIKAMMVDALLCGQGAPVVFGSIIYGFAVIFAGSLAARRKNIPPVWALWTALILALTIDAGWYYGIVSFMADNPLKLASLALVPWLSVFLAALLQGRPPKEGKRSGESFGLFLIGLALGCLFSTSALFNGIASLDLLAAALAVLSGLLFWLPVPREQGIITPT